MAAPLSGKRVLDLGALCAQRPHALAASMAARLCAAYGADVVRPLPECGEPFAAYPPLLPEGGSALDRFLNLGKRRGSGAGAFHAAIGDSASLAAHGRGVPVRVRFSVFGPGEDPPMSELGLLALSGLLGIVGDAEGPPARLAGHQPAYAAGLAACTGLLAALLGGGGEVVEVSLFDVAAWLNWKVAAGALMSGSVPARGGGDWDVIAVEDGHVALVYQDRDWPALCDLVGDPRLRAEAFATRARRIKNRASLMAILRTWFAPRTRAEVTAAAQARRIPIGPVMWPVELLADPQYQTRSFLAPDGMPALPIRLDGERLVQEPAYALSRWPASA